MRKAMRTKSPPSRGAWIEIDLHQRHIAASGSPPSRGAWIEIVAFIRFGIRFERRPPRGGRGLKFIFAAVIMVLPVVAPLAGGVD